MLDVSEDPYATIAAASRLMERGTSMAENAPRRHLALDGTYNTRDIGGYPTQDGGMTRWQVFLRSDNMHELTSADRDTLIDYGVRTVVDLRTTRETEATPNVFVGSDRARYVWHNIIGDVRTASTQDVVTGVPSDRIKRAYTSWSDNRQEQLRATLSTLAEPGTGAAIYHCAGGKDRTGVISALLLDIAGVSRETIAEDYGLTGRYLHQRNLDSAAENAEAPISTWQQYQAEFCPPEGMIKTLQHLDDNYGGVRPYLEAIGLDAAQIGALRSALRG
jgi:protein-tyrosine phosphatase